MKPDTATILQQAADGDDRAVEVLLPVVYDELRELAAGLVRRDGAMTLQPTALVHEAYLKLVGAAELDWRSRTHFFAIAARAMGQVVCDHARGRGRIKRGGGWMRLTLSDVAGSPGDPDALREVDAHDLNGALEELRERDDRAATVIVLRFFGGLSNEDIAEVLGVTARTVRNDWNMARAWLHCELTRKPGGHESLAPVQGSGPMHFAGKRVGCGFGLGFYQVYHAFPALVDRWHQIVLVTDRANDYTAAFVDGYLFSESMGFDFGGNDASFRVGNSGECWALFEGLIDEIGIYDRALTPDEVVALYRAQRDEAARLADH